jgi:hypothetical protein
MHMPETADLPPVVQADLAALRASLDETLRDRRVDHNLLIATWNLRAFGGLTEKWKAGPDDSPKRDLHALACIAEIISRFDVVAIQEVRGDIKALRHLLKLLGDQWGLILTDVTQGKAGNQERLAFVFDTRRLRPSGLACELVLPPEWGDTTISSAAGVQQFARTPYAVSFVSSGYNYRRTFILVTLHVIYGDKAADRIGELSAIAQWLGNMARDVNSYDQNLICLGDFNIDRAGDPNYEAFIATGLRIPDKLNGLPRTIFESGKDNFFDQIAWFTSDGGAPALSLRYSGEAGSFDFVNTVLKDLNPQDLSWKISDHYPLWAEFLIQDSA